MWCNIFPFPPVGGIMKRLAVFDLDGTLHHTELALAPAIARAASDITGEPEPSYKLINSLYGEPLEDFCRILTGRTDAITFRKFMERVCYHQSITIPQTGALYPGVKGMLEKLKNMGFDLAVLSNAHTDYIEEVTLSLGIRDFFVLMKGRGEEASKTERLRELGKGYDFIVMIGDRYHDVQAALENTFPAIACEYGYGNEEEHAGALKAENPARIVEIVKNLLSLRT